MTMHHYISRYTGTSMRHARRGNSLVLVAGILTLLVIIATAFVTRSQGNRLTGEAQQKTEQLEDSVLAIRNSIASELARQLFVAPVDPDDPWVANAATRFSADANFPRRPIPSDAVRYGVDLQTGLGPNGETELLFPYNIAPYETRAWTNWPDTQPDSASFSSPTMVDIVVSGMIPKGPGNDPIGAIAIQGGFIDALTFSGSAPAAGLNLYNPPGNPGFGDFRLLASTEPMRWTTSPEFDFDTTTHDGRDSDAFYQWAHLSNPSRAGNAYRVISDVSDIGDLLNGDGYGSLVMDLNIPVEQFTPIRPAELNGSVGTVSPFRAGYGAVQWTGNPTNFMSNWGSWLGVKTVMPFGPVAEYMRAAFPLDPSNVATNFLRVPTNYHRLKDPTNAALAYPTPGAFPSDEFIPGTARHTISRVLADADGDGFTDSYWFTSPAPMPNGQMQIVAIRVVDNSALVNVNAATEFNINNTRGETPADIAMVGSDREAAISFTHARTDFDVGLLDNYDNFFNFTTGDPEIQRFAYQGGAWFNRAQRIAGLTFQENNGNYGNPVGLGTTDYSTSAAYRPSELRLEYWRRNGRVPFNRNPSFPNTTEFFTIAPELSFTGFDLGSELDLRAYHANNYSWMLTPLEWGLQDWQGSPVEWHDQVVRAGIQFSESVEYDEYQLTSRAQVRDTRRKMTTHSGSRNETSPPWLWPTLRADSAVNDYSTGVLLNTFTDPQLFQSLLLQRRKFDLRGGRNLETALAQRTFIPEAWITNGELWDKYKLDLRDQISRALVVREREGNPDTKLHTARLTKDGANIVPTALLHSYFYDPNTLGVGTQRADVQRTQELCAGMAANILAYRTGDLRDNTAPYAVSGGDGIADNALLVDAVPVNYEGGAQPDRAQLPLEPQPFLTEAFISHVYGSDALPSNPTPGNPELYGHDGGTGNYVIDTHERRTIVAVQIANPFDVEIDLHEYVISVFGQDLILRDVITDPAQRYLQPATEWYPVTATFVAIGEDEFDHPDPIIGTVASFKALWQDFLDVGPTEMRHSIVNYDPFSDSNDQLIFVDVPDSVWSTTDRDLYDTGSDADADEHAVEIRHVDSSISVAGVPVEAQVVVDRFDARPVVESSAGNTDRSFAEQVKRMVDDMPPTGIPEANIDWDDSLPPPEPNGPEFPGIRIGDDDMYVTYVRVARPWGFDFDDTDDFPASDGLRAIEPFERNCRFVFGDQDVITSREEKNMNAKVADTLQGKLEGDVFAGDSGPYGGASFQLLDELPDTETWDGLPDDVPLASWFTYDYWNSQGTGPLAPPTNMKIARKPTFFDQRGYERDLTDPTILHVVPFADKGYYGERSADDNENARLDFPMQMLVKNDDFKQVGELANIWMHGNLVEVGPVGEYVKTERTFAEALFRELMELPNEPDVLRLVGRLHVNPVETVDGAFYSPVTGLLDESLYNAAQPARYFEQPAALEPAIPVGARLFEGFVCDGRGLIDVDFFGNRNLEYFLAGGFRDEITPALININTAPMEVLRTLPHWSRLINMTIPVAKYPWVNVARAIDHYRMRLHGQGEILTTGNLKSQLRQFPAQGYVGGPDYATPPATNDPLDGVRRDYGFESIGELMLLRRNGTALPPGEQPTQPWTDSGDLTYFDNDDNPRQVHMKESWRIDFAGAGLESFRQPLDNMVGAEVAFGSNLSTDLNYNANQRVDLTSTTPEALYANAGDEVAGDAEEANLLFAGASNLITTRSDVFTVYLKVRTLKQNPVTGVWNALDPEMIVDDSRYVMMVDRSNVDSPNEQPIIRYFEKLPN